MPPEAYIMARVCAFLALCLTLPIGCAAPKQTVLAWPPADPNVECVSLLGQPLRAIPPGPQRDRLAADLTSARAAADADPDDPDALIWLGRRHGYLWEMRAAIDVFSRGVERFPDDARFLRHRGHRYISVRQFDRAIADLTRAAELIEGKPDSIEPDGQPNAKNIPLTTLGFNVWYHLGVAHYLKRDFAAADKAFVRAKEFSRGFDDNRVAIAYWRYLCAMQVARSDRIDPDVVAEVRSAGTAKGLLENHVYSAMCLQFSTRHVNLCANPPVPPRDTPTNKATVDYGMGMMLQSTGNPGVAQEYFEKAAKEVVWPAFACIAAEVELAARP